MASGQKPASASHRSAIGSTRATETTDDLHSLPADWRLCRVGRNKQPIAGNSWFDADDYSADDAAALKIGRAHV